MDRNSIFVPSAGYVMRQIAGELLLIPVGEQTRIFNGMITFSETGAFIWNHLDGERNVAQVAQLLADECSVDVSTILPDVEEFLTRALRQGLLIQK